MSHNPDAVPDDLVSNNSLGDSMTSAAASAGPLYPLSGVVAATFLGTPVVGAIVLAIGLWRLNRRNTAVTVVGVTLWNESNGVVNSPTARLGGFACKNRRRTPC